MAGYDNLRACGAAPQGDMNPTILQNEVNRIKGNSSDVFEVLGWTRSQANDMFNDINDKTFVLDIQAGAAQRLIDASVRIENAAQANLEANRR